MFHVFAVVIITEGPVVQSMVSVNHWLSSIKINRLLWYLTLLSANQASSNSAQMERKVTKNHVFLRMVGEVKVSHDWFGSILIVNLNIGETVSQSAARSVFCIRYR